MRTQLRTTFKKLREHNACRGMYEHLRKALPRGDDEPITLLEILDSNGLDDALWALRACENAKRFARLFACDCAEYTLHLTGEYRDCGEVYGEMKHEALHGAVPTLDEMLAELEHLKETL